MNLAIWGVAVKVPLLPKLTRGLGREGHPGCSESCAGLASPLVRWLEKAAFLLPNPP